MAREGGLMAWQWRTYDANHRDRGNLLLHFVAVPAFIGATLAMISCLAQRFWFGAVLSFLVIIAAFAVQAVGHKREAQAPVPFDGPGDFIGRVFLEQFITFPRFILSGGWLRQLQHRSDR
jgi:uncharacterized membrane protein YGL010W